MPIPANTQSQPAKKQPGIFTLLRPYSGYVALLILCALLGNALNLWLPKVIASGIDAYTHGHFSFPVIIRQFFLITLFVFVFTYLQTFVQTYTSEKVARDLRSKLSGKISRLSYASLEQANPSKLLTNLTADVDSIKMFVSQAVVSITSSLFIIIGASILL
ncbi:MAG TPA: ABC transporter transmembrane domain-containing protein, partial [Flavisolibacter sp.]|nr:ABC transporter transmembrane domain-containing protein [Flavisolibacter sp.]